MRFRPSNWLLVVTLSALPLASAQAIDRLRLAPAPSVTASAPNPMLGVMPNTNPTLQPLSNNGARYDQDQDLEQRQIEERKARGLVIQQTTENGSPQQLRMKPLFQIGD